MNNYIHIRQNHKLELRGGSIIDTIKKHKKTLLKVAAVVAVPTTLMIIKSLLNKDVPIDDEWIKLNIENTGNGGKTLTQEWAYSR
jgi:hypothetical protein